jgi:hypothetical protein
MRKGRLRAGLLVLKPGAGGPAAVSVRRKNNFCRRRNFGQQSAIMISPVGGHQNMRALLLGVIFSAVALPCLAQTILKTEPLVLAPYEIAFVQDASCPAGKVLKVTGAIRGLHRRKACVVLAGAQASLAVATP